MLLKPKYTSISNQSKKYPIYRMDLVHYSISIVEATCKQYFNVVVSQCGAFSFIKLKNLIICFVCKI